MDLQHPAPDAAPTGATRGDAVQSVERAFTILEAVADAGGSINLSQLAAATGLPMPTSHRLVRTMLTLGYLRQETSRQYSLGPALIRLGTLTSGRLGLWARPHMEPLAQQLGESVNLALLDGDEVLYVGQVMTSRNSMRMFTEVGRRVRAHATAVGKAMLAAADPAEVEAVLARRGMPAFTENTIDNPSAFGAALAQVRDQGYAIDDGELEIGVRCVAVAVPHAPQPMALSVSGPSSRMSDQTIAAAIAPLRHAASAISVVLQRHSTHD